VTDGRAPAWSPNAVTISGRSFSIFLSDADAERDPEPIFLALPMKSQP
jgi:hypothetical protein